MKKSIVIFLLLISVLFPAFSFASSHYPQGGISEVYTGDLIGRQGNFDTTSYGIADIFVSLVNWFAWFVALLAVVFGLYSGILFITASGDEAKLKKAKDVLIYVVVGVIVAILSFSIVSISESIAGIWTYY